MSNSIMPNSIKRTASSVLPQLLVGKADLRAHRPIEAHLVAAVVLDSDNQGRGVGVVLVLWWCAGGGRLQGLLVPVGEDCTLVPPEGVVR